MDNRSNLQTIRVVTIIAIGLSIFMAMRDPHGQWGPDWKPVGTILIIIIVIAYLRAEINLSPKSERKVKRDNQERKELIMPSWRYKTEPENEIFPVNVTRIGKNLPSFSGNQEFENPLSVIARTNPRRVSDLIEQLSNDKLTAEVDKRSKEMIQEVLRNRPDADQITDRVTIIDKKGPFGILRRRRVHIENVAIRKKGDEKK